VDRKTVVKQAAFLLVLLSLAAAPAARAAECQLLASSVNDYGKDGPARDAQALLATHIQTFTAARGIKAYSSSTPSVSCKLYLDVGLFNEYTCRAEANVCWGAGAEQAVSASGADIAKSGSAKAPRTDPAKPSAKAPQTAQ
jgi:hypothetical protein